ncbi:triose-phosphate isomerase [Faecalicoccus pleomorphus]|nr:triose-phosphate isomerase [Faecalicoccus pleomorphus]
MFFLLKLINKGIVRSPFFGGIMRRIFSINPKSYLYGGELLELALYADKLAEGKNLDVFFTVPYVYIQQLVQNTKHLIITAQEMDPIQSGQSMGKILPESLVEVGCRAVVLNHADKPMTTSELVKAVKITRRLHLKTMICAGDPEEVEMISTLRPDIMICETEDLIGQKVSASAIYMAETKRIISKHSPHTKIIQAAGITDKKDILKAIVNGADGVGLTSGIIKAMNPFARLKELMDCLTTVGLE